MATTAMTITKTKTRCGFRFVAFAAEEEQKKYSKIASSTV